MNTLTKSTVDTSPIAIIAGNGMLPVEVASYLQRQNNPVFVVGIDGEANEAIKTFPHEILAFNQFGQLLKLLRKNQIQRVVLAGGVVGRPKINWSKMDWGTVRSLPGLLAAHMAGDNAILTGVIAEFEKRGFRVCSVAQIMPELLATAGANTALKPRAADIVRIAEGSAVTGALGRFDIGQACVVVGKRAVALEGVEGTDAMLQRVAEMRAIGRLPAKKGGVLVKSVKPGQDERADLPAIGPNTIQAVHSAKLVGIGVQAGKALIVNRDATLQLARELGIFVYGFDPQNPKFPGPRHGQ